MDIRKFFGPPTSKKPTDTKQSAPAIPKTPSANPKTQSTKQKTPKSHEKASKQKSTPSAFLQKSKQSKQSDEDFEIIADSDEEETTKKKVNGNSKGKEHSSSSQHKKESSATVQAKKDNGAAKQNRSESKERKKNGKDKKASKDIDSDSEIFEEERNKKGSGKTRSKKQQVISDSDGDDESPIKIKRTGKGKRQPQVISDSEEELIISEDKKSSKSSKRKKKESDEEPQSKRKGQRLMDSDSDAEDPIPKKKGRKGKKEAVVVDDSDEDKTPKKGSLDAFVIHNAPAASKEPEPKKEPREKKKCVSAVDFFGGGTVQRTERTTAVSKRKVAETVDPEFHDDDDFSKTLEQLDKQHAKKSRTDSSPVKETVKEEGGLASSLASKLATKMKSDSPVAASPAKHDTNSNIVPDTPDFRKTPRKGRSGGTPSATPEKKTNADNMEVDKETDKPVPSVAEKKTPLKTVEKKTPAKSTEKKTPPNSAQKESGKGSAKRNWGAYRSFLNREGPAAPGSKEIPTGAENCLEGLTFVITGVLDSLERDEAKSLVERYGGRVTTSISNRTSYLVIGRDAGASKITKAEQCKTKQVDEDGLLDLIRTLPGKKSKYQEQAEQAAKKEQSLKKSTSSLSSQFTALKASQSRSQVDSKTSATLDSGTATSAKSETGSGDATLMWVDKHKPTSLKQIIGQQGDKSNAKKLLQWLQRWHKNRAAGVKPSGRFYGQDDGSGHRAALLSGPPGIGKTTTAVLVCKDAGFSTVELNASDTRSKRSLKEDVAEALGNQTMVDYMGSHQGPVTGHSHCLIMDEVDGMAGNEDRGGLQELVQLIKNTKIPIITICNDRNSMKMRTLANHCFDLRFQRPRLEQIKGALMSIVFKEGLKVSPPALQEIILSSNQDIRQCIHNLSMFTADRKELTYDQAKLDSKKAEKDLRLGIFDVARKIFAGGEETARMTIHDKSDLFFQDYSFVPLFVHENYINVTPYAAKGDRKKHLSLLARTAESICDGDLVDKQVRGKGSWSLLPMQAMNASVIPGEYMRGAMSGMITFPQWLGKNSSTNKNDRILQELRGHMALQVSCDKRGLNMDYLPALRSRLTEPLAKLGSEGVPKVIELMDNYDIIKDDYDNILEITKWPNSKDPLAHLDSKTKAAFTRQYNKETHLTPYATGAVAKKKRGGAGAEEDLGTEEGEEGQVAPPADDSEDEDTLDKDTMIKASKNPSKAQAASSKGKAPAKGKGDSGKGKGQGKGKGRR
ncbi:replication factor C subunit 1-like isoform X2 [Littorina saxatilis]|uniref:replication factor C subunit 1-like isoform X2 n=1 Tax=Littorina saxatilis TaxID=31220 RepID=UPI0038B616D5